MRKVGLERDLLKLFRGHIGKKRNCLHYWPKTHSPYLFLHVENSDLGPYFIAGARGNNNNWKKRGMGKRLLLFYPFFFFFLRASCKTPSRKRDSLLLPARVSVISETSVNYRSAWLEKIRKSATEIKEEKARKRFIGSGAGSELLGAIVCSRMCTGCFRTSVLLSLPHPQVGIVILKVTISTKSIHIGIFLEIFFTKLDNQDACSK